MIARFARMSSESTGEAVAGIYSLDGDQMDMFDSLKKRFLEDEDAIIREFQHLHEPENLEN